VPAHAPESTCLSCGAETPTIDDRCGACGAVKDPSRLPTPTRSWPRTLSSHLGTVLVWLAMFTPGLIVLVIALSVGSDVLVLVAVVLLLAPLVVQLFGADWGDRADHSP
jgi:hypothetical protein